jgi:hypothetical protein
MKLHYIHWADEKCCPRKALSLYQSQPDAIRQVHECPHALSHPDAAKPIKDKNPEFYKALKKVYDKDKLRREGDWTTENWWTGKYSLLAGFFLSEEDAREAIKVYVKERNKHNEEVRQHERENHPGRYSEKELNDIYSDVEENDFAVGAINIPDSKESCKIRNIAPKKHCGNCRFRIVEDDLERREPMGCLYHLDESFYSPMGQVCARWMQM